MTSTELHDQKLAELYAMAENAAKSPGMPVSYFLQEVEDTYHWSKKDRKALTDAGLDWKVVEEIPIWADLLRKLQSEWMQVWNASENARKEWKLKSPEVTDLRDILVHDFRYAFRKDSTLMNKVALISKGGSNPDMLQDLSDLAVLGKSNMRLLQRIKFDMTKLDKAAEMAGEMAELLAVVNGDRKSQDAARLNRDKAYAKLKEALDEVRNCGKYVFWRTPSRLKGYSSDYYRTRRGNGNLPDTDTTSDLDSPTNNE